MVNPEIGARDYSIDIVSRMIPHRLQNLRDTPGRLPTGLTADRIAVALAYLNSDLEEKELSQHQGITPVNFRVRLYRARIGVMSLFEDQLGIPSEVTRSAFDQARQNYILDQTNQKMRENELAWEQSDERVWFTDFQKWLAGEDLSVESFPLRLEDSKADHYLKSRLMQSMDINFSPEANRKYMFIPLRLRKLGKFIGIYDTDQTTMTHQYMLSDKHGTPLTSAPDHLRSCVESSSAGLVRLILGYGPEDTIASSQPLKVFISTSHYVAKREVLKPITYYVAKSIGLSEIIDKIGVPHSLALPVRYPFDTISPGIPDLDLNRPYNTITFSSPSAEPVMTVAVGQNNGRFILQTDFIGRFNSQMKIAIDTKAYAAGKRFTAPPSLPQ